MKKTLLSLSLVFVMFFSAFASGVTAYALPTPTSASSVTSTTVYCMPNSTSSMTIGSIGIETVSVYWAEGNSYYIQYTVSSGAYSGYKRGYVPKSAISVSGIGGINYTPFPAHTSSNQTVYNRNTTSSMTIGTVYSSDNIKVLQEDGTWYYIEYPITGGYKRGYVPKSTVVATASICDGLYYIKNVKSSKYLDVAGSGTTTGSNVIQFSLNKGANQQWQVTRLNNGDYCISPSHTSIMALSVYDNYTNNGSNIVIRTGAPPSVGTYSRWNIVSVGNGAYKVVSKCSGTYAKVMVVEGASMANSANVIQYSYNGTHNDEWIFEPIDPYTGYNWQYVFDDADFVKISNGYKSSHKAIDIVSKNPSKSIKDAPIICPANGEVIYANWDDGAGNYVIIKTNYYDPVTGNRISIGFQHMSSILVTQGTKISRGTVIGYVGTTGSYSTGYHLHLYMMRDSGDKWANGKTANPQNFYPNTSFTGSTGGPYTID